MTTDSFAVALGAARGTDKPDFYLTPDGVRLKLTGPFLPSGAFEHEREPYRDFEPWFHALALFDPEDLPWRCEIQPQDTSAYKDVLAFLGRFESDPGTIRAVLCLDGFSLRARTLAAMHALLDTLCGELPPGTVLPGKQRPDPGACETHCCPKHGCKYTHARCLVEVGLLPPRYSLNNGCEMCKDEAADPGDLDW